MERIQDDATPMPSLVSEASALPLVAPRQGYPVTIFPSGKADEKFCCSYCKLVLRDPMQSSCGHRYCLECLGVMKGLPQPLQCQSCVAEGTTDEDSFPNLQEAFDDKAARREMKKLQVKCVYTGCVWKGTYNDYVEHEDKCDKKKVPCKLCKALIQKNKLANHETKNCPKRIIQCNFCKKDILFEAKEKHNAEECPKYQVKCPNCQMAIERSKLGSHEETECANRKITCPLPECTEKLTKDRFFNHISKEDSVSRHIFYLLTSNKVTGDKLELLGNTVKELVDKFEYILTNTPGTSGASSSLQPSDVAERTQGDGAHSEVAMYHEDSKEKLRLHEDLMTVLHSEILRCINRGEATERSLAKSETRIQDCYSKIEDIQKHLPSMENPTAMPSHSDVSEYGKVTTEGSGQFTWIIPNYRQLMQSCSQGHQEPVCSPPVVSAPGGYAMKLKLYPNGTKQETGKSVSLFLQLVPGPHDDLLLWPFHPTVTFMIVDQLNFKEHHVRSYQAETMSPASRRPTGESSQGGGLLAFVPVQEMTTKENLYWPKNTVYLKFCVETPIDHQERLKSLNPLVHLPPTNSSPGLSKFYG